MKPLYTKGTRIYCIAGHHVGEISRDIQDRDFPLLGDVILNDEPVIKDDYAPVFKPICKTCGKPWAFPYINDSNTTVSLVYNTISNPDDIKDRDQILEAWETEQ